MKFRTFSLLSGMVTIGIVIFLGWFIICTVGFFTTDESQKIYPLTMTSLSFIGMLVFYIERRKAYSATLIDERGITNKCGLSKDIFIAWDECEEIGIGKLQRGYGLFNQCVYFSKNPLTQKQINYIQNIGLKDDHLWLQCTDEVLTEVLKYVPKDRIKNIHLRDEKSR